MDDKEDFTQLKLSFADPVQHDYEVIRPNLLFSQLIAERSRETEIERTTVGEKAKRIITEGMLGLVDQRTTRAGRKGHICHDHVLSHDLYLKQLYPPIHYREIVRILARKFGYKTNHRTAKSFLERYPIPFQLELELTTFH